MRPVTLRELLFLAICACLPASLVAGCGAGDGADGAGDLSLVPGPLMRPGWNCLSCHRAQGQAAAHVWSAGGTVFEGAATQRGVAGVDVVLTDEQGKSVRLTSNAAGNFHTAEPLQGSLAVRLERNGKMVAMPTRAPAGSCNFCHVPGGDAGAFIVPP